MRRQRIFVLIAAVAVGVSTLDLFAEDITLAPKTHEYSTDFYVPKTISEEAQDAVKGFSFEMRKSELPAPNDLTGWKQVWQSNEDAWEDENKEIVEKYQPSLKEMKIGGIPVISIMPNKWKDNGKVLIYTHGGAYTLFSAKSTLTSAVPVADATGLRVISVDYTTAPFAKWDKVTDQIIAVIQALRKQDYDLDDIAIYGDSAGGGLAAGTVLKMRDRGMGMPAAVVLWSPWSDITETGDTYDTLRDADPLLSYKGTLDVSADAYAKPKDQKNPYVSPIYADYTKGFSPTLIQGGTKEIFLSNFIRQYQVMDLAGIPVKLDLYEGMWHVFQAFNHDLPESHLARKKMKNFLKLHLKY